MSNFPKVLFIGLDAASRDLVLDWSDLGLMPNLRRLRETGSWGFTQNAPAIYTGSLWPSMWTGMTAGRHGCYYNQQLRPGTYEIGDFLGREIHKEPFWNALSRAGKRVCVFDVPKTPVSHDLNGLHVVDWGTHDSDVLPCSWPAELIDDLHRKYGAAPFRRCDWVMDAPDAERTLRKQLLWRMETKAAIAEDLLQRDAWDVFLMAFGESHCVGHQCWHLHDPSHPKHKPALRKEIGDPVQDIYLALDQAVGRVLQYAGPETVVIVLCSHGMSTHYDATYLLDEVLRRFEKRPVPLSRRFLDRTRKLWKKLPLSFTEQFGNLARSVDRLPDSGHRRDRSCFAVPTNANTGGIRLNLAGREPNGKLQPGQQCEEFIARLIGDLQELTEPASGRPLVREVLRSRDLFPGENANLLPDLFVRWHRETPITGVSSPKIGTIVQEDTSTRRTGDHRSGGLYFVRGPGIPAGVQLPPAQDEDIAPTVAALLGVQLEGIDGRPLFSG
jgi:predicted AlkP superfamily phosphohydrolase/phosphomutase